MEAVTINLSSRLQRGCEVDLMLLKGRDEWREDGL
jgi:hypothetical protein